MSDTVNVGKLFILSFEGGLNVSESEITYTNEELEAIKEKVLSALEQVIDPELGIDIVKLGLI